MFVGFCVFLRIICVLLRFFLRTLCLWFGAFGDQDTAMFTIRRNKLRVFLSLGAGRWDHAWIVGRMSRNNIFCVCICSKKVAKHVGVSNSWNRIYWPDTQRSSILAQAILITHVWMTTKSSCATWFLNVWSECANLACLQDLRTVCAELRSKFQQDSFFGTFEGPGRKFWTIYCSHFCLPQIFFLSFARGFHPL